METKRAGRRNACALWKVVRGDSTGAKRQWPIGELIGIVADYNPLSDPEEAGDKILRLSAVRVGGVDRRRLSIIDSRGRLEDAHLQIADTLFGDG